MEAPDDRPSLAAFARLTRWWSQATSGERFEALKASIRGDEKAPPLKTLHLAIIAAEIEAAREGQRGRAAAHGAAEGDA
jgi:hypothetical protein